MNTGSIIEGFNTFPVLYTGKEHRRLLVNQMARNDDMQTETVNKSDDKRDYLDSLAPQWATRVLTEDEVEEAIDWGRSHTGESVVMDVLYYDPETGTVLFHDREGTITEESTNSTKLYVESNGYIYRIDQDGMVDSRSANREEGPWDADPLPIWLTGLSHRTE
jgi:hypothetical protein